MKNKILVKTMLTVCYWLCFMQVAIAQHARVDSCHQIGADWKNGTGGKTQDFEKACYYFRQGAENGYIMSSYDYGFMLYKGLGCKQDYTKALEMFMIGVKYDHTPSLYMAGLCYRNGYGVERDEERGMKLLRRASLLGYRDAEDEMKKVDPENSLYDDGIINNNYTGIPDIDTSLNDINLLAGKYQGFLVQYDWSGQHVISEKPIAMTMVSRNASAEGTLCIGNDTVSFMADITTDGCLEFRNSTLTMPERYTGPQGVSYRMEKALLNIWQDKICGRLDLYSLKLCEPERPMYIELIRKDMDYVKANNSQISISPNPFTGSFKANFFLENRAINVQARFFNSAGVLVDEINIGNLSAGQHSVDVLPTIPAGLYVLNVKADNTILRTIVIKKGASI